jgi:serine/threonine protein kinase
MLTPPNPDDSRKVLLSHDAQSEGLQIAIKGLSPGLSSDSQRESFNREVQILATVAHKALQVCTYFTDAGPYIITAFMPGGSLQYFLSSAQRG